MLCFHSMGIYIMYRSCNKSFQSLFLSARRLGNAHTARHKSHINHTQLLAAVARHGLCAQQITKLMLCSCLLAGSHSCHGMQPALHTTGHYCNHHAPHSQTTLDQPATTWAGGRYMSLVYHTPGVKVPMCRIPYADKPAHCIISPHQWDDHICMCMGSATH